jgi:hypothetical protein
MFVPSVDILDFWMQQEDHRRHDMAKAAGVSCVPNLFPKLS